MSFKSFLNWIQSDQSPEPEGKGHKQEPDWREKRRDNRIDLDVDRHLSVNLLNPENTNEASTITGRVMNVSVRGCSILLKEEPKGAKVKAGQIFIASLAVDDFPIPLQVEVVRVVGPKELAIRFKPPFPRELEKLEKFLEPRCLGRSLREIDKSKLQKNQQKGMRWFQGVNETHLFCWKDPETGEITQQQLVYLDRVVEWKDKGPIRTGMIRVDERGAQGDYGWVRTELLDFDSKPDATVLNQAKVLVESSRIDAGIKKVFLSKL